jgi:hypothetical protein
MVRNTTKPPRAAWNIAMALYRQLDEMSETASAAYGAAYQAYDAERPKEDMIPFHKFHFQRRNWVARVMDVDFVQQEYLDNMARKGVATPEARAEMIAAFDRVREYRRLDTECERRHNLPELGERSDHLCDSLNDALNVLVGLPAPDADALLWKLEQTFIENPEQQSTPPIAMAYAQPIFDDARRFLASGDRTNWDAGVADLEAKAVRSSSIDPSSPEADRATEAECQAMDHLVENIPSPDILALAYKIELTKERWAGCGAPDLWLDIFASEARRFGGEA